MARRQTVKPDRPKLAPLFRKLPKGWITFEPMQWAMLGGFFFGFLSMIIYFLCNLAGIDLEVQRTIIGVVLSFVAGYGLTGIFVWYLLVVASREIPEEEKSLFEKKKVDFGSKKEMPKEDALPEIEIPVGEMPHSDYPVDMEVPPESEPGVEP